MRFTIVTPSFNQLDWLELCIASVADQQGVEFVEHIVQDAGTPGIEEFARRLGAAFYRDGEKVGKCDGEKLNSGGYSLTIYSEKDAGMYDAVNRGLLKASGGICAYLNCDEQYLPGTLSWVGRFFSQTPDADVLFGDVIVVYPDGKAICHRRASVPHPWHVMVAHLPIFTAATFFRSEVVTRGLLFPDGWRDLGDAVWAIKIQRSGLKCHLAKRFLATFTDTGENMNLKPNALAERVRLFRSAPRAAKAMTGLIVCAHRFRKLLTGAYWPQNIAYEMWCKGINDGRTRFHETSVGPFWSRAKKS